MKCPECEFQLYDTDVDVLDMTEKDEYITLNLGCQECASVFETVVPVSSFCKVPTRIITKCSIYAVSMQTCHNSFLFWTLWVGVSMQEKLKWQKRIVDEVATMTIMEILDALIEASVPDDYDGCWTNRGWRKKEHLEETMRENSNNSPERINNE